MKNIERALDKLVEKLATKGYNVSSFQTNSGHSDSLGESIRRYLESSLLGLERKQLTDGLSLTTYLEYNGEDKPYIEANMKVKYDNHAFNIIEMQINRNLYGFTMKKHEIRELSTDLVPQIKEAISMVKEEKKSRQRKFNL